MLCTIRERTNQGQQRARGESCQEKLAHRKKLEQIQAPQGCCVPMTSLRENVKRERGGLVGRDKKRARERESERENKEEREIERERARETVR